MNNDLISRQQAFDALHCRFADGFEEDRWWNSTHVIAVLKGLPAVPPERKMGRWIQLTCDSAEWWYCSECNGRVQMNPWAKYNYCPNCGAKIKGGEQE